jgi:leucyl aminopeptidase
MNYSISNKTLPEQITDCLVLAINPKTLPASLPRDTAKAIQELLKNGDLKSDRNSSFLLPSPAGLTAKRLLLISTGENPLNRQQLLKLVEKAAEQAAATGARSATLALDEIHRQADISHVWLAREITRTLIARHYRFDDYKNKKAKDILKKWQLLTQDASVRVRQAMVEGEAIGSGQTLARDLGNQPPNVCYPEWLAEQARVLEKQYSKLKVSIISEKQAEKMGMGAFKAVSRGSAREGCLIIFEYKGASEAPVALVGKGITFDTGGISLKPGAAMDEMKFDMCGAASVFGAIKTVCELNLKLHLVGVVAAAENMPDGNACRPGDIVTTLSGQTVEILNTDAEGRLVLCDALTYVQKKFKPHTVIDMATLTGACVIALGSHAQAIFANDHELGRALIEAGDDACDRGWPMPLWEDYQEQLDSPFADFANIGGRPAGSITAACFLSRFTKNVRWAHLDIAGTAWLSGGKNKGATGRPVPLLTRYLIDLAHD